jgi:hypothetical protein
MLISPCIMNQFLKMFQQVSSCWNIFKNWRNIFTCHKTSLCHPWFINEIVYAYFSYPVLCSLIVCESTNCEANHCITFSILLLFLPLRFTKSHQSSTFQLFTQKYNAKFIQDFLRIMWLVTCNSHLLLCCSNYSFSLLPGYIISTQNSVRNKTV